MVIEEDSDVEMDDELPKLSGNAKQKDSPTTIAFKLHFNLVTSDQYKLTLLTLQTNVFRATQIDSQIHFGVAIGTCCTGHQYDSTYAMKTPPPVVAELGWLTLAGRSKASIEKHIQKRAGQGKCEAGELRAGSSGSEEKKHTKE
eukprot:5091542-Amphidinium_carterae.1